VCIAQGLSEPKTRKCVSSQKDLGIALMYAYRHFLFEDNKHKTDIRGGMAEKREAI